MTSIIFPWNDRLHFIEGSLHFTSRKSLWWFFKFIKILFRNLRNYYFGILLSNLKFVNSSNFILIHFDFNYPHSFSWFFHRCAQRSKLLRLALYLWWQKYTTATTAATIFIYFKFMRLIWWEFSMFHHCSALPHSSASFEGCNIWGQLFLLCIHHSGVRWRLDQDAASLSRDRIIWEDGGCHWVLFESMCYCPFLLGTVVMVTYYWRWRPYHLQ